MLDQFKTLITLAKTGTMQRTAIELHVSQSTVSKRIAELERLMARRLIEPRGRRVVLTSEGVRLVKKGTGALEELMALFNSPTESATGKVSIEIAVSILVAGGAEALAAAKKQCSGIELSIVSNHSAIAIEKVRSGQSMIAIVQGSQYSQSGLSSKLLGSQEMVIVPSGLNPFSLSKKQIPVLSIESFTEASQELRRGLKGFKTGWPLRVKVASELQSFSAIVQMARAGFGHGLAPKRLALTLGIPERKLITFPAPGLSVPVSFVGRESTLGLSLVMQLFHALEDGFK